MFFLVEEAMKADVIIFDKDGTLLDFDAFWVSLSRVAIGHVLADFGMDAALQNDILEALGVHDGVTDINGVLCKGTYEEMGHIVYAILQPHGLTVPCKDVVTEVEAAYARHAKEGVVKPTCPDLADTLAELKEKGARLAVVTTDNEPITRHCLEELGILSYFDAIFTDDGHTPTKPDPYCAEELRCRYATDKARTFMVGDTMTDVRFAKNAGITAVALAPTPEKQAVLAPAADILISAISELPALLA